MRLSHLVNKFLWDFCIFLAYNGIARLYSNRVFNVLRDFQAVFQSDRGSLDSSLLRLRLPASLHSRHRLL